MDEFKGNGASKLKNALRWLAAYVRYHCLREAGASDAEEDSSQDEEEEEAEEAEEEESAHRPTEVRLLSQTIAPLHGPSLHRLRSAVPWQLEGYTLQLSKHSTVSGYANVTRANSIARRWVATIWVPEPAKRLGIFDKPEQAALAVAKYRAQLAGQSQDGEDSEDSESEEGEEEEEEEPEEESAHRPTEVCSSPLSRDRPLAHAPSPHAAFCWVDARCVP